MLRAQEMIEAVLVIADNDNICVLGWNSIYPWCVWRRKEKD